MAGYRGKGRRRFEPKFRPKEVPRTVMLNIHRLGVFRYDIREIMVDAKVDPALSSAIVANVMAKASRVSIDDAKNYVREVEQTGGIDSEASECICILLDRYSRYR